MGQCHTLDSRNKRKLTKKLDGSDQMIQCRTEASITKAKIKRSSNGTDKMKHCHLPEIRSKINNSRKLNILNKNNILLLKYNLFSIDKEIEFTGSVIEISSYIFSERYAFSLVSRVESKASTGKKFPRGKWKGYYLEPYLE